MFQSISLTFAFLNSTKVGWSAQKVSNVLHMLLVVRTLVSPANPNTGGVTSSCQTTMLSCGLLEKLCSILLAAGIPAEVLTETIVAIAEVIRCVFKAMSLNTQ